MRTLAVLVTFLLLSACSLPVFFRVPVVQGNVVTAKDVRRLELGMTKRQVQYVMGTSLVDSSFERDRWDYVFYYRDPRAHVRESELNLFFANEKLAQIEGDEEYTRAILKGEPLPSDVTPGPNNDRLNNPYNDDFGPLGYPIPDEDGPLPDNTGGAAVGAPLPGT